MTLHYSARRSRSGAEEVLENSDNAIDIVEGIRAIRLLTVTNEKFGRLKAEDLIDDSIVRKLEREGLF